MTELYALGIKPDWWKLEPQASRQGLGEHRSGDREATTRGAAAWCCWASKRRRTELAKGFAAVAGTAHRQGLRRGPHHLQRRRAEAGCAGEMTTSRRDDMARVPALMMAESAFGESSYSVILAKPGRSAARKLDPGLRRDDGNSERIGEEPHMSKTIRLTAAQALVRFMTRADDHDRRREAADLRRHVGDLRAWQCGRHGRGAVAGARRAADLSRPERAVDGACGHRLCQGDAAAGA